MKYNELLHDGLSYMALEYSSCKIAENSLAHAQWQIWKNSTNVI